MTETTPLATEAPPRRLPVGGECQCVLCGILFSSESAFDRHFTRPNRKEPTRHVHPSEVGLVESQRRNGPVWGFPSDGRWD